MKIVKIIIHQLKTEFDAGLTKISSKGLIALLNKYKNFKMYKNKIVIPFHTFENSSSVIDNIEIDNINWIDNNNLNN